MSDGWRNRIVGHGEEAPEQLLAHPLNWRVHPRHQQEALAEVLATVGVVQEVLVNSTTGHLVDGHLRVQLAMQQEQRTVPVKYVDLTEEEERLVLATLDPIAALAVPDQSKLEALLADTEVQTAALQQLVADLVSHNRYDSADRAAAAGRLRERFMVPPFSVLDARQGYWQERKSEWREVGVHAEEGKEHIGSTVATPDIERGPGHGGSHFDPVLAELAYRWWAPPGAVVLDPWAGEATKGVVAAALGLRYVGLEVRPEQVQANMLQWVTVSDLWPDAVVPEWVRCDAVEWLRDTVATGADLLFSSPPYWNLEQYRGGEHDGSGLREYADFVAWYREVLAAATEHMAPDAVAVLKVADVRDGDGYAGFLQDTLLAMRELGWQLLNEAVLVTPVGSMPIRATQFAAGRKLVRGHQNVLAWWRGEALEQLRGEVEYGPVA